MSLLKQLLLSVTMALLGILAGTLILSCNAARNYLAEQLHMQSENAASSLALSLSQPGSQDPVIQELLISALFDTGDFRSIEMYSPDGQLMHSRKKDLSRVARVPAWFARVMSLPQAQAQRVVSDGWRQTGAVTIVVDDDYALVSLWRSSTRIATLVVLAGLVWAAFVTGLLRWFRRVLRDQVAPMVMDIGSDAQQGRSKEQVAVSELRSVMHAIEHTRVQVQQKEKVQQERIESLELETNRDPITQLPNRKYFLNELKRALSDGDGQQTGYVLMMHLCDLPAMNARLSRQDVDEWLRTMGARVQDVLNAKSGMGVLELARLNGSDFALLLPRDQSLESMHLVQEVRQLLMSVAMQLSDGSHPRWAFALSVYGAEDTPQGILARLDYALMQAESAGHGNVEFAEASQHLLSREAAGKSYWRELLMDVLQQPGRLNLEIRRVMVDGSAGSEALHEASLQLHDEHGQSLIADLFLPAAVRLGLSADFDLKAIGLGLQWLQAHADGQLVVRISVPSLEDADFVQQVCSLLAPVAHGGAVQRLVLEVDAYALEAVPARVVQWAQAVAESGVRIGLRRVDRAPAALLEISRLHLLYLKVGAYFAVQSASNAGGRYLLEALVKTAHAQQARVYVPGDSLEAEIKDWLSSQGVCLVWS